MENTMKHTDTIETIATTTEETAFLLPETDDPEYNRNAKEHNINYCLRKIDEIGKEIQTINNALCTIQTAPTSCPGDEPANAAAAVIRAREETYRKKIDFYRDMIDRFLPPKKDADQENERRKQYLDWIKCIIYDNEWDLTTEDLVKLYREFQ